MQTEAEAERGQWGVGKFIKGHTHAECEILMWIKAVRGVEGVEFIYLSVTVKYSLAQTRTRATFKSS